MTGHVRWLFGDIHWPPGFSDFSFICGTGSAGEISHASRQSINVKLPQLQYGWERRGNCSTSGLTGASLQPTVPPSRPADAPRTPAWQRPWPEPRSSRREPVLESSPLVSRQALYLGVRPAILSFTPNGNCDNRQLSHTERITSRVREVVRH